jgi:hypothetical protein
MCITHPINCLVQYLLTKLHTGCLSVARKDELVAENLQEVTAFARR